MSTRAAGVTGLQENVEPPHTGLVSAPLPVSRNDLARPSVGAVAEHSFAVANALLARLVSRLPGAKPPVVQFLSLDRAAGESVIRTFCLMAAEQFGTILSVEVGSSLGRKCVGDGRVVPDVSVPGLSHGTLRISTLDIVRHGRPALLRAVGSDPTYYDMILLGGFSSNHNLDSALLAGACSGTVLIARAGVTTLHQLRASAVSIKDAGGLLLGVVLAEVPPAPRWLRQLSVRR
jgi:hypothetical protein